MKGFKTFAKGIGGAVLRSGDGSAESAVEVLLQRVGDGVLAEDRQEALADLRDLISNNTQARLAVGAHGLPMLCTVVKEERQDIEMLRGALECLTIVIGPPSQAESAGKGPHPAAVNAEMFSRGKDNIGMLLGFLEDEPAGISDFYVRYHTIQLLTSLAAVSSLRIQEVC
ncbi:MAG: golgin candidate 6-like [Trebouxia sp. A1-2]|nr:MAG: golgin candidate 6-like [Trebouxia sp. A1-2]